MRKSARAHDANQLGSSKERMAWIPVIDLQLAAAAPEEAARLRDAAQRLGCFRAAGHGVPRALQDDMKAAVRALFDLPDDAKRRNTDVISGSGYVAPSATNPLYEAFGLYDAASPADVDAFCASLHAPPHIRYVRVQVPFLSCVISPEPEVVTVGGSSCAGRPLGGTRRRRTS